jgi:hypothetical protein
MDNNIPVPESMRKIIFRLLLFSSSNMETGIHKGQTTWAKNKKRCVLNDSHPA